MLLFLTDEEESSFSSSTGSTADVTGESSTFSRRSLTWRIETRGVAAFFLVPLLPSSSFAVTTLAEEEEEGKIFGALPGIPGTISSLAVPSSTSLRATSTTTLLPLGPRSIPAADSPSKPSVG